jgi:prepilin signal peptidase PulO-like enzyme (type II secretory pathway)
MFAFVTFVLGGAGGLVSLVRRRSLRGHFAFGPWMVVGAVITIVWEQNLRSFVAG